MKQFNLTEWLQDKSRKVVTRDGRPVRIVCTDSPDEKYPITGFIKDRVGAFMWKEDGIYNSTQEYDIYDLFFADEDEDGLLKFEKIMIQFSHERNSLIQFAHTTEEVNAQLHMYSEKLLDLARKEIERKNIIVDKDKYLKNCNYYYEHGKQDALKDLPNLDKIKDYIDPTIPVMYTNAASMKTYVEYNGYKLCINDVFEKLQKEE